MKCHVHYSQNPNTILKIRFFYTQVLWRVGSSEHGVIPSKLMKKGWKYPLKQSGRGWRSPLERYRISSPADRTNIANLTQHCPKNGAQMSLEQLWLCYLCLKHPLVTRNRFTSTIFFPKLCERQEKVGVLWWPPNSPGAGLNELL